MSIKIFVKSVYHYLKKILLSNKNELIDSYVFIHIDKNAGTSIEKALRLAADHSTALEKLAFLGDKHYYNRFTFSIVRNPWDRTVSLYKYIVKKGVLGLSNLSFKDWVIETYVHKNPMVNNSYRIFMPQLNWISDMEGNIIVDFVGKFENLDEDFKIIAQKCHKNVKLPHINSTGKHNYRDYYDEDTKEIIRRWYMDDIERFNYSF
jgi:chondroitin 4-sulfotransferase 11